MLLINKTKTKKTDIFDLKEDTGGYYFEFYIFYVVIFSSTKGTPKFLKGINTDITKTHCIENISLSIKLFNSNCIYDAESKTFDVSLGSFIF